VSVAEVLAGEARSCIEHAKCEAFAPTIPDGSVNLLWLDPPYFRVVDEEWDRAWKSEDDFLAWLAGIVAEAARTLAPNGSLYMFASPQMGGRVEGIVRDSLDVLNHIVWVKRQGWHAKAEEESLRCYFPQTERVIFAEPRGADSVALGESGYAAKCDEARAFIFEPLRSYLVDELARAGWTPGRLNEAMGFAPRGMAETRYFGRSQWQLPTERHYATMQRLLGSECLRRQYDDLRRQYDDLRRPFAADLGAYTTDVWEYETVTPSPTKHPCEKPAAMLRDVVRCSSRPNDVVCEFFGGSFRMAEVALSDGRRYIGCDADEHWAGVGIERARAAERGTVAAVPSRKKKVADDRQPSLFGGSK
jgi:site-specific DNA-methyltransferase (adenine-specific)